MTRKRRATLLITVIIGIGITIFSILYIAFNPQAVNVERIITYWKKQTQVEHSFVPISQIPPYCQQAFIAIEDKNFYAHIGIDLAGMIRGISGVFTGEDLGGSTIPQQLIKNYEGQIFNRSLVEKVTETIYAIRLNFYYPKEYILETYLNVIYLGDYNYGIEAAAHHYFDKHVEDLNVEECAYLAALPQAPEVYKPSADYEAGKARQQLVLRLMREQGYISE